MASLCYNKGCGQRFDPEHNTKDSCLYHPGVPIFHDALKGWSCCKKRTTDFSEFLSIKGCTKGFHSKEKPPEPVGQEEASDKLKAKPVEEVIIQRPKSAEKMQQERPSFDEPRQLLPIKVSRSLEQALQKLNLSSKDKVPEGSCPGEVAAQVRAGTTCKNAACKAIYQGPESNREDKAAVLCRQDWHQTSSQVVVTVYAKNPLPALSSVKANHTVLEVHIIFEGNKIFQAELDLWGVIKIEKSFVSMVPTKVEITLCKASPGSWARLELPQSRLHSCGEQKEAANAEEPGAVQEEDSDDSLSWSEEDEELEMRTLSI
ncbi:integrin beta-1-binding protein 2 isoform X2 [Balearica regulorum gibbericeps]|uniref:integrin beta-1-binding protein 2 isoform X2 n=1 Tax=Balearica regulorum gibbericeps TaxID=100784 RepID=UPI003F5FEDFA